MEYKKEYLIAGFPLIKFHNKDIIEKTQKGSFYMNSLKYYRDIFDKCGDEEIGDPYEGKWYIHEAEVICPQKSEYNQLIRGEPISTVSENDFVYCMLGVNPFRNDMNMFAFSNLQKEKWTKTYDTALVITDIYEYFKRIKEKANSMGYRITCNFVNYYDPSIDDYGRIFAMIKNGIQSIAFYKRNRYEYQQEFRFVVENKTQQDHIELNIGDISDISEIISSKEALSGIINEKKI